MRSDHNNPMPRFRTHSGASNWWKKTYPHIRPIGFAQCDIYGLREILGQFHRLAQDFPEAAKAVATLGFGATVVEPGAWGLTDHRDRSITFGQSYFCSEDAYEELLNQLWCSSIGGDHPYGSEAVAAICTHEFGHALMATYMLDARTADTLLSWLDGLNCRQVAEEIESDYSCSKNDDSDNKSESFAELFTALYHSEGCYIGKPTFEGFVALMEELRRLQTAETPACTVGDGLIWHYTHINSYERIAKEGILRPDGSGGWSSGEMLPLLWFSSDPVWDLTLIATPVTGLLETDGCLYRFGIAASSHGVLKWDRIRPYSGSGGLHDMRARGIGADTRRWYVTTESIPTSETVIQVMAKGEWIPIGGEYAGPDFGFGKAELSEAIDSWQSARTVPLTGELLGTP